MATQGFRETVRGMTAREKAEYLWEYYRWVLLVAAFAVMVIAIVVTGIVNSQVEIVYSGALVNVQLSEEGSKYLTEDWAEQLGAEKKQKADLFVTSFQDLQTTSDTVVSSAMAMQVVLMIMAEDYDYVIMDAVAFDFYKNHSVFTSLDMIFDRQILAQWEDAIVYHETEESGRYPIALDITDTAFAQAFAADSDRVYIAFPGNTGRTELNDDFLAYLLNWE